DVSTIGQVQLFNTSGPLQLTGQFTMEPGAILQVTIGIGVDRKGSGRLTVANHAALAGELKVLKGGGYTPVAGDAFEIVTAGSLAETFDTFSGLDLGNGLTVQVEASAQSVVLRVIQP
ncbi:MAG TPA: hypothetical protein VLD18_13355, partial [Verrucomicrobiae bacterium]|nr:hypothetical protein [Verrucomicrobiae bacterium]